MTTFNFQPDDPRLTAYALGELDPSEQAQVEALLAESAEARVALEGIRETVEFLRSELTFEPELKLTSEQRQTVEEAAVAAGGLTSPIRGIIEKNTLETQAMMVRVKSDKPTRWGVIGRVAAMLAAVAVVALAAPYFSRVRSKSSSNELLVASADVSETKGRIEFAQSKNELSARSSVELSGTAESLTQLVAMQPMPVNNQDLASPQRIRRPGSDLNDAFAGPLMNGDDLQSTSSSATSSPVPEPKDAEVAVAGSPFESIAKKERQSETPYFGAALDLHPNVRGLDEAKSDQLAIVMSTTPESKPFLSYRRADAPIEQMRRNMMPKRKVEDITIFGENARQEFAPGTEAYDAIIENAFLTPMEQPLSTFSIDVDTASYANTRRFIQQGQLPPTNAVRIEELINYFRYDYPEPTDGSPFSVNIDVATCPWAPQHKLARVGLKAKTIAEDKRPATNLVFLIDVSGSMAPQNKLPLVKQALNVLVSKMGEDDQIAIVTYAGNAGLKLNSTSGSQRNVIQQAIDSLSSGGSTNGVAGIQVAYDTAIRSFIKGGANRVILCTDGDFNVGVSDDNTLVEIIQEKAASGVFLSVFGFGMGNLKDAKLEKLADKGNGNYGYIDGLQEARKVFGEQLSGTLITVAKDVKLQLDFNNSTVGAYRLIGYENRVLAARDFDDDTKDAGEIGAGHTVTALYEIVPKAVWLSQVGLNPEKFDVIEKDGEGQEPADGRLFTVKLRHKLPDAETSERSVDYAAMNSDVQMSDSNVDLRFAAAVASFGMQLRDSRFRGQWSLQNVLSAAEASLGADRNGERTEFTDLVRGVMRIKGESILDPRHTSHPAVESPADLPPELSANDARIKATVEGKYRRLLKKIEVRSDITSYGEFQDFGHWDGTAYADHSDLPTGYWVWVHPNWYIWGDAVETGDAVLPGEPE